MPTKSAVDQGPEREREEAEVAAALAKRSTTNIRSITRDEGPLVTHTTAKNGNQGVRIVAKRKKRSRLMARVTKMLWSNNAVKRRHYRSSLKRLVSTL